ncbi:hypothetical protein [Paenibacillus sp. NPDC058174]|uniref:hypothetical protein n=1 Tax=Paenibacillus sp. NPDC058174 TaxID=3346366 RepID=UPI0036D900EA
MKENKKRNSKWIAGTVALSCFVMLATACSSGTGKELGGPAGRETVNKPDKTITVINEPVQKNTKLTVSGIATIDNARGMNFAGSGKLIISRPNKDVEPIQGEGEKVQPNNIYLYDLQTKTAEALAPASENQGFSEVSPDGKYLFYKMTEEATAFGRILNLETKQSVMLGKEPIDLSSGQWIDNSHVFFTTLSGKMLLADTEGNLKTIAQANGYILTAAMGNGGIYYVAGGDQMELYFQSLEEGAKPEKIAEGVEWIIPSPDMKQLAMVKKTSETMRELSVVDGKGKTLLKITKATQIFGTRWSPDGTKLAYSLTSENGGDNGIFVADALTGETTSVLVEQAADTLNWDATGTKLVTSTFKEDQFRTSIISLN